MPRADELELRRLTDTVAGLRAIAAPPRCEGAVAARVREELGGLGLAVDEDAAAAEIAGETGNLRCRLPGLAPAEPVLLTAHLDDGGEVAVALLLAVAHRARTVGLPCPVDLLFTVASGDALAGARALVAGELVAAPTGYAFEHPGAIGELVGASPTAYRIDAEFLGHAGPGAGMTGPAPGQRPEGPHHAVVAAAKAVAAMPHGQVDEETTADVASVASADGAPDRCLVVATARSLSEGHVETVVADMVDHCYDAANDPDCACDVDIAVERLYPGYRHRAGDPEAQRAEAALRVSGHMPRRVLATQGSVANLLQAQGVGCVNLADGADAPHELLDVVFAVLDETLAASEPPPPDEPDAIPA